MKRSRTFIFFIILVVICIASVAGMFLTSDYENTQTDNSTQITAYITQKSNLEITSSNEISFDIVVEYTYKGSSFEGTISKTTPTTDASYDVGCYVSVYVDIDTGELTSTFVPNMQFLFIIVAIVFQFGPFLFIAFLVSYLRKNKNKNKPKVYADDPYKDYYDKPSNYNSNTSTKYEEQNTSYDEDDPFADYYKKNRK